MAIIETSTETRKIPDRLFEEAAVWHARVHDPEATEARRAGFARWLAADPMHAQAYAEAERLWCELGTPVKRVLADQAINAPPLRVKRRIPPARHRAAIVAGLLLVLGGGLCWQAGLLDDMRSDYVTATGAQRTVALADGSQVVLNTDSALAVAFAPEHRAVRLFRGEAWFDVTHDPGNPFVVETPEGTVQVTGTQFNVRIAGDQVVVSLVEGSVALTSATPPAARLDLAAQQQAVLSGTGIAAPTGFDAAAVTAWQHGQLIFYRTPLEQVVAQLNRYRKGRIVVTGAKLRDLPVTGVFDAHDSESALTVIQNTLHARIYRLTDYLVLLQ